MSRIIRNEKKFLEYYENFFTGLDSIGRTYFPEAKTPQQQAKLALETGYWDVHILTATPAKVMDDMGYLNIGICPKCGEHPIGTNSSWAYSYTWRNGPTLYLCKSCYDQGMLDHETFKAERKNRKGCYIATVCYGSETDARVITLKLYRDKVLSNSFLGKLFIRVYYLFSPHLAKFLQDKRKLNSLIEKHILQPLLNRINKKYKL